MRLVRLGQVAVFAGLALATVLLARRMDSGELRPYDVGIVPRSSTLRWLSLGHPTLAANLLWLRAVQYVGEPRGDQRGWDKLFPLVDAVTDLDPRHGYAYQVAGTLLPNYGRVAESNAILEKGLRALPERYILPLLRSFNAFQYDDDWAAAGRFASVAARTPGAPDHVRHYALAFYVKGQRADAAVDFLTQILAETRDPETRAAVEEQFRQAVLERDLARLDAAVAEWRRRHVTGPLHLQQLVGEGLVPAIPSDPFGGELRIDEGGVVRSSVNPFRFSRPERQGPRRNGDAQPGGTP